MNYLLLSFVVMSWFILCRKRCKWYRYYRYILMLKRVNRHRAMYARYLEELSDYTIKKNRDLETLHMHFNAPSGLYVPPKPAPTTEDLTPCSFNCKSHVTHPCEKCGKQWDANGNIVKRRCREEQVCIGLPPVVCRLDDRFYRI